MKLTLSILLSITLLTYGQLATAQENVTDENAATLSSTCNNEEMLDVTMPQLSAPPAQNTAMIQQNGVQCTAQITQNNAASRTAAPNYAYIVQTGSDNDASIDQQGASNVNVILQNGSNNSGTQDTDGEDNRAVLLQNGDNNQSVQILTGDNICSTVIQQGNANQIYRVETGSGGLNYRITQNGDGMSMTIINGR